MKCAISKNGLLGAGLCLVMGAAFGACSPKVYIIDRQTVLEEEAAGDVAGLRGPNGKAIRVFDARAAREDADHGE